MLQLPRYIETLLLDNDCVIVPGLGGFVAHRKSARYYADTQSFLPPLRELGFNVQLQINDSLLAQQYIEAYDISYPEALLRIGDEVEELRQLLRNEGECELSGIGLLKQDIDGRLEFIPCEAGILTPSLYGLDAVDVDTLTAKENISAQTVSCVPTPVPHLGVTAHKTLESDEDIGVEEERTITIRVSTIRNIATAAAVIIALFVCAIPFGKLQQPELTQSYIDTGIFYSILPEAVRDPGSDAVKPHATPAFHEEAKEARHPGAESKPAPATKEHFFSIVLASRVKRSNAATYVKTLRAAGYDKAEIIERSNGAKVVYGRFASKEEARQFLVNVRSHVSDFNDGWVMEF